MSDGPPTPVSSRRVMAKDDQRQQQPDVNRSDPVSATQTRSATRADKEPRVSNGNATARDTPMPLVSRRPVNAAPKREGPRRAKC